MFGGSNSNHPIYSNISAPKHRFGGNKKPAMNKNMMVGKKSNNKFGLKVPNNQTQINQTSINQSQQIVQLEQIQNSTSNSKIQQHKQLFQYIGMQLVVLPLAHQ